MFIVSFKNYGLVLYGTKFMQLIKMSLYDLHDEKILTKYLKSKILKLNNDYITNE